MLAACSNEPDPLRKLCGMQPAYRRGGATGCAWRREIRRPVPRPTDNPLPFGGFRHHHTGGSAAGDEGDRGHEVSARDGLVASPKAGAGTVTSSRGSYWTGAQIVTGGEGSGRRSSGSSR